MPIHFRAAFTRTGFLKGAGRFTELWIGSPTSKAVDGRLSPADMAQGTGSWWYHYSCLSIFKTYTFSFFKMCMFRNSCCVIFSYLFISKQSEVDVPALRFDAKCHEIPLYFFQGATVECCPTGPTRIPGTSTANIVTLQDAITSVKQVVFFFLRTLYYPTGDQLCIRT